MANQLLCVVLLLSVSLGASVPSTTVVTTSKDTDASSPPPPTFINWTKNIWGSLASNLQSNWDKVANGTVDTFNVVSSGVKDGWDQVANSTAETFGKIYPQLQEGLNIVANHSVWGKLANGTTDTFNVVSSGVKNGWDHIANRTEEIYPQIQDSWNTVANASANIFETASRLVQEDWNVVNETAILCCPGSVNDSETCNNTSINCTTTSIALKTLKVIGIAFGGGFLVALVMPLVFSLVLNIIGFTFKGVARGSAAASYQSRVGNVEDGSCFSFYQSMGATGWKGVVYKWIFGIAWLFSSILIGYLIWPSF